MVAEIICVGTELLLGNIVNTNAAFLAEQCAALGLSCYYQSVVGDNEERLFETVKTSLNRSDIVILSGGLGPTQDDLTKEVVAKVIGKELVLHEPSRDRIRSYFTAGGLEITQNNWKQAYVPEGAVVIDNDNGTAPGLIVSHEGKHVLLLPGPPGELKPMFTDKMVPFLRGLGEAVIHSRTVKICGMGESKVETLILDLLDEQTNPTVAPYAKTGEVHLRVTAKAASDEEAMILIEPVLQELDHRFGKLIYTTDPKITLEQAVVNLLEENHLKIATAESCTGGLLAGRLTRVAGVSTVFQTGLITYSNETKERLLGVSHDTLMRWGAVSEETAAEMAAGLAKLTGAEVCLSITGIAGPTGGTKDKPVGLVYLACRVNGETKVKKLTFKGNRDKIRESSAAAALSLIRSCILKQKTKE